MTPQELKNSILQLAIQGKLVPQRAEEGSAEELYKQIKAEKKKLIKEKKIKKEKPLPEITDDEKPFEIPETWKWVRLGNYCIDIFSGKSPIYSKTETNYKVIGQAANQENGLDFSQLKYTVKEFWDSMEKRYFLQENDILLNTLGNGTLGRLGIIQQLNTPLLTDGHLFIFRCSAITLSKFCYYFLQWRKKFIEKNANGSTNQIFLSLRNTISWLIPLPPLAEQKRIIAKIEELLPYVEQYEKAYNELQELDKRFPGDLQKSILQLAIQGRLVPQREEEGNAEELYEQIQAEKKKLIKEKKIKKEKPLPEITDDEKPFDIPETWKWVRLGDVTILNPKNNLDDNLKTAFIPMALISDGYLSKHTSEIRRWSDIKKGFTHFANDDIGVAKITPCFQNKKSVIFSNLENGYGAGTTELSIIRVIHNLLLQKFVLWFVKTEYFIKNGVKSFTGTAGQQRIHKDYLKNCLLPLPPLAEQKRIVAKIEELLPLCDKLKN